MGVSSTEASLREVRQDLDLGASGSILERAVLNKVNKQSGPVSLAEYKGNILGTQLLLHKNWGGKPWKKIRNESSGHLYITRVNSDVYLSGNRICISVYEEMGDNGMEARLIGKVTESGRYRLTGKTYGRFSGSHDFTEMHVNLISNVSDYLSGVNDVVYRWEQNRAFAKGEKTHSVEVNLNTSRPYITLCLRQINKYGGQLETYVHDFWDWKLEKI
jgi:hypothetical protein